MARCEYVEGGYLQRLNLPPHVDLSTVCPHCLHQMTPEHAHYRCTNCGQRDACCLPPY
jgi:tRNA(Ile2) C34 agmatinyltransferase TiaS